MLSTKRLCTRARLASVKPGHVMETLKTIARALRQNLDDATRARTGWIENVLERADLLARARAEHASDAEFGHWLAEEAIEINPHNRAALLKMAKHPVETRAVLETTESWSLRLIWENEIEPALYGRLPKTPVDSSILSELSARNREFKEAYKRGDYKTVLLGYSDEHAAAVFAALKSCTPGTPEYLEEERKNLDAGTLEWVAARLQKYLSFAIDNFDLAGFPELIAKARERLHGNEDELIAWLRDLGVPVPDDLPLEDRIRAGCRRAYYHKKTGGAGEALNDFLTRR
jgi:hypothetical protein